MLEITSRLFSWKARSQYTHELYYLFQLNLIKKDEIRFYFDVVLTFTIEMKDISAGREKLRFKLKKFVWTFDQTK